MEQNCENFPPCFQRRAEKRFLDRIAEQEKNWKFSIGDFKERAVSTNI